MMQQVCCKWLKFFAFLRQDDDEDAGGKDEAGGADDDIDLESFGKKKKKKKPALNMDELEDALPDDTEVRNNERGTGRGGQSPTSSVRGHF